VVPAKSESKKKMDQHAHDCTDQPEQRRKRHDFGMIFRRRAHETGLATPKVIATA
jgi:hypothetical protein